MVPGKRRPTKVPQEDQLQGQATSSVLETWQIPRQTMSPLLATA